MNDHSDRDLVSQSRLDVDTMDRHERATYRSGTWLGTKRICAWTLEPDDGGPILQCDMRYGHDGPHRCKEVSR